MDEATILDFFRADAASGRDEHYTHFFPGGSRAFSTEEFVTSTAALAQGLANLGVGRGDRVMLLSDNRPEWHMVDLATLDLGAVDVPVYATLTPDQIAYQLRDSGSIVAVTDTAEHAAKFLEVRDSCPALRHVVQIDGEPADRVITLDDVIADGASESAVDTFWERATHATEEDLATIIYTSGTTGDPKGVMLTHRNFVQNGYAIMDRLPELGPDDLVLEFLPLCHVFERCAGYVYMARAQKRAYCATALVGELVAAIAPSGFCSVPRVFEKVHDTIISKVQAAPPVRQKLFRWALKVGSEMSSYRLDGEVAPALLALRHRLADRLVLSKVRRALGGKLQYAISGAAALSRPVNEFFHSLGISIQEGYGLTETSPAVCFNGWRPRSNRLGSVGKKLDNLDVKLDDDGELLVRGPSVMKGYWNKPDETAEAFDEEGYFRTGDIARIDEDGFIFITDRKKELIVTAGGKNVAPQPIENELKQSPLVDTAVLLGDRQPFIAALLTPTFEVLEHWASERGLAVDDRAALLAAPEVRTLFEGIVADVNAHLARYEQVKEFRLLNATFSIEDGQLTPTMKVKRRVVEEQFRDEINQIYSGERSG